MAGGRKLAGSAQKRGAEGVLQHGSIPLNGNFRKLPGYLRISAAERERQSALLAAKCCCVEELAPEAAEFEPLVGHLMDGFAAVLPFDFEVRPWNAEEIRDIEDMVNLPIPQ
jgi:lipoate-protein ligase A